ncbi:factor-independent urate hydroxylase [Microbacterium sp. C23T]
MSEPAIVLGANQYGKAEVRLVRVDRGGQRHTITDLDVTSQLRGDFTAAHIEGDNARIVATDTQKNTVFAFARDGVGTPEEFLLRLGRHFIGEFDGVTGGRWEAEQYTWNRIPVDGEGHDHSFVRGGTEIRTAVVTFVGPEATVISGLRDLAVLKSAGSEFHGFVRDRYTTLADTDDRILATSVTARWRYNRLDVGFDESFAEVRRLLLEAFAETHSLALQQTLYEMGRRVLEGRTEIDEIRFSMPNLHHFAVDLTPFGLDNPNEVFYAADRPYGLIEAAVLRDGVRGNHPAWHGIAGFC